MNIYSNIILATTLCTIAFTSCKKATTCDPFHEGMDCEMEIRSKYYGNYLGTANDGMHSVGNSLEVSSHPNGPDFLVIGTHIAQLKTANTFEIPLQDQYTSGITYQVKGNGFFGDNTVNLTFTRLYQGDSTVIYFEGKK